MAIQNVGFDFLCPQAPDRAYGTLSVGKTVPYSSVAAANTAVPAGYRYRGKTVFIDDGTGAAIEYWWRVDTQDASLVPKINGEQTIDFVIGDGQAHTPTNGSTVLTHPALVNAKILGLQVEGGGLPGFPRTGQSYWTYDPVAGTITFSNTDFSTDTWYNIKFRQL